MAEHREEHRHVQAEHGLRRQRGQRQSVVVDAEHADRDQRGEQQLIALAGKESQHRADEYPTAEPDQLAEALTVEGEAVSVVGRERVAQDRRCGRSHDAARHRCPDRGTDLRPRDHHDGGERLGRYRE